MRVQAESREMCVQTEDNVVTAVIFECCGVFLLSSIAAALPVNILCYHTVDCKSASQQFEMFDLALEVCWRI